VTVAAEEKTTRETAGAALKQVEELLGSRKVLGAQPTQDTLVVVRRRQGTAV
jgi:hypothetical protein